MTSNQVYVSAILASAVVVVVGVAWNQFSQQIRLDSKPADKGVLTPLQRKKLVASWKLVESIGLEAVGCLLFKKIFTIAPGAIQLFSFRDDENLYESRAFKKHCRFVMEAIRSAVEELDDAEALIRQLTRLGQAHQNLGIVGVHYEVVGQALMETLGKQIIFLI
jgi:hemoglobin-like flavoprotein